MSRRGCRRPRGRPGSATAPDTTTEHQLAPCQPASARRAVEQLLGGHPLHRRDQDAQRQPGRSPGQRRAGARHAALGGRPVEPVKARPGRSSTVRPGGGPRRPGRPAPSPPSTAPRHRPTPTTHSSPQITNGTLARALIMLVWIRWPQVYPLGPKIGRAGQCPRRPHVPPQPADRSPRRSARPRAPCRD